VHECAGLERGDSQGSCARALKRYVHRNCLFQFFCPCSCLFQRGFQKRMPLGGGIRQRLGLPSRRWGAEARSRSPRGARVPAPDTDPPADGGQPVDLGKEFRNYISELFMENSLPGTTSQKIFHKATGAGARGSEDLAKCGTAGKWKGNASRDLMRKIMKGCTFPSEYWVYVPVINRETQEVEEGPLPALLPHEALAHRNENDSGLLGSWLPTPGHTIFHTAQQWCDTLGVNIREMIPIGLHGDGVPFASKMGTAWNALAGIL